MVSGSGHEIEQEKIPGQTHDPDLGIVLKQVESLTSGCNQGDGPHSCYMRYPAFLFMWQTQGTHTIFCQNQLGVSKAMNAI